jgi:hypothetical protein
MRKPVTFALVPIFCLLIGCTKVPTERIASAEQAMSEARAAGAPTYLGERYAKLESMLITAKQQIMTQDEKFVLLRDYSQAEELLESIQMDAARVTAEAERMREAAKAAALQAQQAAQASVKATQELVDKALAGGNRAALVAQQVDADGLTASLAQIQAALDTGDYQGAQVKAGAIAQKSEALAAEVRNAQAAAAAAKGQKRKAAKAR